MRDIIIKFSGRKNIKARVSLNKSQFEKRNHGLIQYLSSFCNEISWDVLLGLGESE